MVDQPNGEGEANRGASRREQQRQYRKDNAEKVREWERRWRRANPEKVKQQRERYRERHAQSVPEDREKYLERKRIAERERRERARKERAARERAVERAREWDNNHRDRVKERSRRYRAEHQEQIRERQREYYHRNKERINSLALERLHTDPKYKEIQARYRRANVDKIRERQRAYRSDPDVQQRALEYNREWRRRERRRVKSGLPRIRAHHTPKVELAKNAAAANAFFDRTREIDERRRIIAEFDQLRGDRERAERIAQRRRAERAAIARERANRIDAYLRRHGAKMREDVRMDSRARELRGASPYPDLEEEVRRRAAAILGETANRRIPQAARDERDPRRAVGRQSSNTGPIVGPAGASRGTLGM
jgi:hypothetical protein